MTARAHPAGCPWPHMDARLTELWAQSGPVLSARAIGDEIGVSKNSIIGRAHRLHLPARPSPIKGAVTTAQIMELVDAGMSQREIATATGIAPSWVGDKIRRHKEGIQARAYRLPTMEGPALVVFALVELPKPAAVVVRGNPLSTQPAKTCCWPIGERPYRWCEASALVGKPYCKSHADVAYRPMPDRRESAA